MRPDPLIDPMIRANLIAVLARVRTPRSLRDIHWHVPHYGINEVAFTLDRMALLGEVEIVALDVIPVAYVLRDNARNIVPVTPGWSPERVARNLTLTIIGVGLLALAILLWKSLP